MKSVLKMFEAATGTKIADGRTKPAVTLRLGAGAPTLTVKSNKRRK
jgi:hypothetical protein